MTLRRRRPPAQPWDSRPGWIDPLVLAQGPPRHDTLPRIPHQPSDDSHQGAPVLHRKIRLVLLIMQLYPSGLAGLLIIDMIASGQPPLEPS